MFFRIAESSMHETEEVLRANEDQDRELSLMETLLVTPGLTRKDVITIIMDMLFAGIDTVRREGRAWAEVVKNKP